MRFRQCVAERKSRLCSLMNTERTLGESRHCLITSNYWLTITNIALSGSSLTISNFPPISTSTPFPPSFVPAPSTFAPLQLYLRKTRPRLAPSSRTLDFLLLAVSSRLFPPSLFTSLHFKLFTAPLLHSILSHCFHCSRSSTSRLPPSRTTTFPLSEESKSQS